MKKVSLSFAWRPTGVSVYARALSRERGIQLQFAADSFCMMTIPPLFLSRTTKKIFFSFLPRWWRWWRLFWQQSDICWTNTLLLRQICTFFCQNFPVFWCGSGGSRRASHGKTTTLMNMSANVGEFLPKTTSRNPYKKTRPDYCGKWQHAIRHSCNYHLKILLFMIFYDLFMIFIILRLIRLFS